VLWRQVGQAVSGFEGEIFEDFHRVEVRLFLA
jgi:hypothetical protein